jgi:exopolysaccharide biosynthesis protein
MNLDDGGSTTMWIKGKGVVNHPPDGAWDALKERKVGSIIYLK